VHTGGTVDIPFPRPLRDELLAQGLAAEHRWASDSGWITFVIRSEDDARHAAWLMRLSYLRYAIKSAPNASALLDREGEQLHLAPEFKLLFGRLIRPAPSDSDHVQ